MAAQQANNTSTANTFASQTNGNIGANNVSKVDVHTLLYPGATTKVYAHLMLWFGGSNHMNVGYSSTDSTQVHQQISDMVSRGIDGVIVDWYGPNDGIDQATKLVMAEAETHPGFTFAIMVDQGAIEWNSCSGCSPQQALINQLQYVEQTYFPSKAYMTLQGKPVVTNFNIDLSYSIDWNQVTQSLATQPAFVFQNNDGFSHVLSDGSYSWVMPTTSDFGMNYLASFYNTGMTRQTEETVGASYKGFNDTLASWGSNRIMKQQCGQTWLQTFSKANSMYSSGNQLSALQLVTWNDYEEGTEIESGIDNCVNITASVTGNSLQWKIDGDESTIDHYVPYVSVDGQNLMSIGEFVPGTGSVNLCSYSISDGSYTLFVQAIGKPSMTNRMSAGVTATVACGNGTTTGSGSGSASGLTIGTDPSRMTIASGNSGTLTVSVAPTSGSFNNTVALTCSGLPSGLNCSFSPGSVTPGVNGATSLLTVSSRPVAAAAHTGERRSFFFANWLVSFGMFGILFGCKVDRRRMIQALGTCAMIAVILGALSCGGNTNSPTNSVSPQKTYVVTVNGNAGSIQLSTAVTVTVQ